MSDPPAASAGSGGAWRGVAWGATTFAGAALAAQLLAFAGAALGGADPGPAATAALGWLYLCAFTGVGLAVELPTIPALEALGPGGSVDLSVVVAVAFLTATGLLLLLLVLGGRAAASRAGGGVGRRVLHGLAVAPGFALPIFLLSLAVRLEIPSPEPGLLQGSFILRPSPAAALAWPLALAALAGAAGGLLSARAEPPAEAGGRLLRGAARGGWWMFSLSLVLAFGGLLVHAAVDPRATAGYLRWASSAGPGQAALRLAHHVLVLPNQSVLVLAPAMGGCDGLYGSGVSIDVLCTTRFPAHLSVPAAGGDPPGGLPTLALPRLETRPTPAPYYLFVLVPLSSVLLGGWAAARGARSRPEAIAAGAAGGVPFAGALALTAHLGALRLSVSAGLGGIATGGGVLLGTEPLRLLALGLAWGVVGGGLGAALAARALPTAPPPPSEEEEAPAPLGGPDGGTPQRDSKER